MGVGLGWIVLALAGVAGARPRSARRHRFHIPSGWRTPRGWLPSGVHPSQAGDASRRGHIWTAPHDVTMRAPRTSP